MHLEQQVVLFGLALLKPKTIELDLANEDPEYGSSEAGSLAWEPLKVSPFVSIQQA